MSGSQGISFQLETIYGTRSFHLVAVLNLVFLATWDGVLGESLEMPKGCETACHVSCGTWDGSGASEGNQASSRVDLGYMELFRIAAVNSGSL